MSFITYKFRLKSGGNRLRQLAVAVNRVWNFCVATQKEAQRRRAPEHLRELTGKLRGSADYLDMRFRDADEPNIDGAVIRLRQAREAILSLLDTIDTLRAERDEARALAERLKLEAQGHAMEARGANATIYEIYQVLSGGKGEPGNWHGAEPARAFVARAEAALAEAVEALEPFAKLAVAVRRFVRDRAQRGGSTVMPTNQFRLADFERAEAIVAAAIRATPTDMGK